jgi:hypothetical protein
VLTRVIVRLVIAADTRVRVDRGDKRTGKAASPPPQFRFSYFGDPKGVPITPSPLLFDKVFIAKPPTVSPSTKISDSLLGLWNKFRTLAFVYNKPVPAAFLQIFPQLLTVIYPTSL